MFETEAQQTVPPGVALAGALSGLEAAVGALAGVDPDVEGDRELAGAVVSLQRLVDRLVAQQLRLLGLVDRREAYAGEGAVTVLSWLRGSTRLDHRQAARRVEAARRLPALPRLARAFAAGEVTFDHVTAVTGAARPHRAGAIGQCEAILVELARRGRPADVRRALRLIGDQVDPDGSQTPPLDARGLDERRELEAHRTVDGLVEARMLLDQVHGEALLTVVDAWLRPDPAGTPLARRRTATQRRADALGAALLAMLDRGGTPARQGRKPHVTLMVDLASLLDLDPAGPETANLIDRIAAHPEIAGLLQQPGTGAAAAAAARGAAAPAGIPDGARASRSSPLSRPEPLSPPAPLSRPEPLSRRPPRLRHTGTLDRHRARALVAQATVQAVLTLGPWRVVHVGRTHRRLPAWLRGALEAVHGHCRGPHCDRPVTWADAHHTAAWSTGGSTDLNQTVPLCRAHHELVTRRGWRVTFDPDTGVCTWTSPAGRTMRTYPPW